ncbi:hypothetical protein S83_033127, partial [Arachis hypogaea]
SCHWEDPNRERRSPSHTPPPVTAVAETRTDSLVTLLLPLLKLPKLSSINLEVKDIMRGWADFESSSCCTVQSVTAHDLVDIIKAQLQRFNPIVGGGLNASVIHYLGNNQKLNFVIITKCCLLIKQGDRILMDVGCELHGY